jgi:hypothetical protein
MVNRVVDAPLMLAIAIYLHLSLVSSTTGTHYQPFSSLSSFAMKRFRQRQMGPTSLKKLFLWCFRMFPSWLNALNPSPIGYLDY